MAYGERYRLDFTDELGNEKRVSVLQDGYAGAVIDAIGSTRSPVFTSMEGQNNEKYRTMRGTEIAFSVFSQSDFEFLSLIATASEREFKIELRENGDLKHVGFVIPETFTESYTVTPYEATIRAVSLGALKGIPYPNLSGRVALIDVLVTALEPLGFDLNIWDSVNSFESGMDSNISPLLQVDVDQGAFLRTERGRPVALSCYDVIEQVLAPFAVNFFQDDGAWKIIPIESNGASRLVRIFDHQGELVETITHNPESEFLPIGQDSTLQTRPALRSVASTYEHSTIPNLAENGDIATTFAPIPARLFLQIPTAWELSNNADFPSSSPEGSTVAIIDPSEGGPRGIRLFNNGIEPGGFIRVNPSQVIIPGDDDSIRLRIRYAPQLVGFPNDLVNIPFQLRIGSQYLTADGSWSATPSIVTISDLGNGFAGDLFRGVTGFRDYELFSEEIPASGDVEFRLYRPFSTEQPSANLFVAYASVDVDYYPDGEPQTESRTLVGERAITSFATEADVTYRFGDAPTNIHPRGFTIDNAKTQSWTRGSLTGSLDENAVRIIASEQQSQARLIQGTHRTNKRFDRYFTDFSVIYYPIGGSYDERLNYFNGSVIQRYGTIVSVSVDEFVEQQTSQSSGSPASSNPVGNTPDLDNRYFRQSLNLSEGDPALMRASLGLAVDDDVEFASVLTEDWKMFGFNPVWADASLLYFEQQASPIAVIDFRGQTHTFAQDAEATIALNREILDGGDLGYEFLDIYNNYYDDSKEMGIQVQSRAPGVLRPFYFKFFDGVTRSEIFKIETPGDGGRFRLSYPLRSNSIISTEGILLAETGLEIYGYTYLDGTLFVEDDATLEMDLTVKGVSSLRDIVLTDELVSLDTFAPGFSGSGMQLERSGGEWQLELDSMFIRGSLFAYEFIINQISAVNGSEIMSAGRGKVERVVGSGFFEVSDPSGNAVSSFAVNDIILVQQVRPDNNVAVKRIFGEINSVIGNEIEILNLTGAPANVGTIEEGDIIVVIGNTLNAGRQSVIFRSVIDGNAPFVQVRTEINSYAAWIDDSNVSLAYANLNGTYGYSTDIFGFAAGDKDAENITVDPVNGLRIRSGADVLAQLSGDTFRVGQASRGLEYNDSTNRLAMTTEFLNISDTIDYDLDSFIGSPTSIISGSAIGDYTSTQAKTQALTIPSNGLAITGASFTQIQANLPTFPTTATYLYQYLFSIQGRRVSDGVYEDITSATLIDESQLWDDPCMGSEQDPCTIEYTRTFANPLIAFTDEKYDEYRLRIENTSFDGTRLSAFSTAPVSPNTQIGKDGLFTGRLTAIKQVRIIESNDEFVNLVTKRTNAGQLRLVAQFYRDNAFVGEEIIGTK